MGRTAPYRRGPGGGELPDRDSGLARRASEALGNPSPEKNDETDRERVQHLVIALIRRRAGSCFQPRLTSTWRTMPASAQQVAMRSAMIGFAVDDR